MATAKLWLNCYECGEQFETEVGYYYSSKQVCGDCKSPKVVEVSRYKKRQLAGQAKREAKQSAITLFD